MLTTWSKTHTFPIRKTLMINYGGEENCGVAIDAIKVRLNRGYFMKLPNQTKFNLGNLLTLISSLHEKIAMKRRKTKFANLQILIICMQYHPKIIIRMDHQYNVLLRLTGE